MNRFSFLPGQPPSVKPELGAITAYIRRLEQRILSAFSKQSGYDDLTYLTAEPARYWAGMIVLADGTNWDPGSGEGAYRRDAANASWVFLG